MPADKPAEDPNKAKFREALERKRGQQSARHADSEADGASKIHGSSGPGSSRKMFRRKSGG